MSPISTKDKNDYELIHDMNQEKKSLLSSFFLEPDDDESALARIIWFNVRIESTHHESTNATFNIIWYLLYNRRPTKKNKVPNNTPTD
ncbi:hypothetical protein DERP_010928 [Dermatophagoides pteronyssinus]|uniref:Uncharacterized protein n=1 Tax=Dermatophagoides pteronyssinus TaxID=6956 RepID=A0ABQ8JV71_DERPT|nr:hypothetical protein DERP_010928 [Dermatophagoides pteronyssinus]